MEARDVFAGSLDDFISLRDSLVREAKAAGDPSSAKAIAAWRKPTRAAWLVNILSRAEPDQVAEALAVGESLAQAHRDADATQLRELSRLRTQLIAALTRRAVELGREKGYEAPEAARAEVSGTLTAGLGDPQVADAIRAGTLSRTVRAGGFGPADMFAPMADVIQLRPRLAAAPDPEPEPTPEPSPAQDRAARLAVLAERLQEAEAAHARLSGPAEEARARLVEAEATAGRAADAQERATAEVERLRTLLTAAETDLAERREAGVRAREAHEEARAAVEELGQEADTAKAELDEVRAEIARAIGLSSGP
ncbi:hypothetical protein GCM10027418_05520 [Mariniluteicoccus endophyticus]